MSKNRLMADDVAGFVRAFNDEREDTERAYNVRTEFTLRKTKLRAELLVWGEAFKRDENAWEQLYATAGYVFPTHRCLSVHAALYAAAMRLNVAVQQAYHEEHGHYLSSHPVD